MFSCVPLCIVVFYATNYLFFIDTCLILCLVCRMTDFCDQPLGLLAEVARRELVHLLETFSGPKDLIVDASLLRPLDKIASMSLLQNHGCARVIPLKGNSTSLPWNPQVSIRVYMLRLVYLKVYTIFAKF